MSVIPYPKYSSSTGLTLTLASLATSATFVAGRESTQVDNTTTKYKDVNVLGKITVGTTPTANTFINVYIWGSDVSLATTPIDVLDGTDSAETITNTGVLGCIKLLTSIPVLAATSDVGYPIPLTGIAQFFGGYVPEFWGIYVAHNTGVNLNATGGNHVITWYGVNDELI